MDLGDSNYLLVGKRLPGKCELIKELLTCNPQLQNEVLKMKF